MAKSFPVLVLVILVTKTGEKAVKRGGTFFVVHFLINGVGRHTDPGGAVVLDSPVSAKEMTALRFLMRAPEKGETKQKRDKNSNFWGDYI